MVARLLLIGVVCLGVGIAAGVGSYYLVHYCKEVCEIGVD